MLDRILNGDNPYSFSDYEDWSHEIPPLELCQNLLLWDIRVLDNDDYRFNYGEANNEDDNRFNYEEVGEPQPSNLVDVDGGEASDSSTPEDEYDFDELSMDDYETSYFVVDVDGGELTDDARFNYCWVGEPQPTNLVDIDGGDVTEDTTEPTDDYDFVEMADIEDNIENVTDGYDFNDMLYNMPEKYANIYSVTVYCIARILEDEIIKKTGDWLAKYEIHPTDYPETQPYINIHIAINPRLNKVYVEFSENQRLKALMGSDRLRLGQIIDHKLNTFFDMTFHNHRFRIEIMMPEDEYTYCCDSSPVLSCHTIFYWRSLYGKYSFLEDREEVKHDIAKKGFGYNRKSFYDKIHALNQQYQMSDIKHYMIPEVFNKYKAMYKEEFNTELPYFHEAYIRVSCKYNEEYRPDMYGENFDIITA